jgi:hypothetical protein
MAGSGYRGSPGRVIVLAGLMLGFLSQASWASWDPEDSETCFSSGELVCGGQLAVTETMFLPRGSQNSQLTKLVAITDGYDHVRLYSLDTSGLPSTLISEDQITIDPTGFNNPVAFTPTFMELVIDQTAEPCLVIPVLAEGSTGGSISIVRLTERSGNQLVVLNDCFDCNNELAFYRDLYYVADLTELESPTYAISIAREPFEEPNLLENYILYSDFSSDTDKFEATGSFILPDVYYGDRNMAAPTRPCVTKLQEFEYGDETPEPLCYTTAHNGGVIIWDPAGGESPDIYWISASQFGTWIHDEESNPPIMGELGDVHRAVILEGADDQEFEGLGGITVDSRLLFFADFTMGFMICDVSRPTRPQHVWQWDCDLRPCEEEDEDWDWHGSGDIDSDAIAPAEEGTFPGETFGIGVAFSDAELPYTIHLYLAGGIDGLRLFDLSEFLDPFGVDVGTESNFDDFSMVRYEHSIRIGEELTEMRAYDLQALSEDGNTYVFTSWKQARTGIGSIGLTVHLDEDVVCD